MKALVCLSTRIYLVSQLYLTAVHFIADDSATFTSSTGTMLDATKLLGGPRSKVRSACCYTRSILKFLKRYVIITNDNKVERIDIEEDPSMITCTASENILELL